jgi:hypothetical protein
METATVKKKAAKKEGSSIKKEPKFLSLEYLQDLMKENLSKYDWEEDVFNLGPKDLNPADVEWIK